MPEIRAEKNPKVFPQSVSKYKGNSQLASESCSSSGNRTEGRIAFLAEDLTSGGGGEGGGGAQASPIIFPGKLGNRVNYTWTGIRTHALPAPA